MRRSRRDGPWEGNLGSLPVAAHPVEQHGREPVGERVDVAARPEPGVRPVRSREEEQRGGRHVEIGPQLAPLEPVGVELADPLLVAAALGDEALAPLAAQVAPLPDEDRRHVELAGDHREVPAQREPDPLGGGRVLGHRVERGMERLGALAGDVPEEILLGVDVVVERRLLHAERFGQVGERRPLVAALGEEARGGPRQLETTVGRGGHYNQTNDRSVGRPNGFPDRRVFGLRAGRRAGRERRLAAGRVPAAPASSSSRCTRTRS